MAEVVRAVASALPQEAMGRPMLVNLNFPALGARKIEGVMRTVAAPRQVEDHVEPDTRAGGGSYWILRRAALHSHPGPAVGTDIRAVRDGHVSITGLTWNLSPDQPDRDVDGLVAAAQTALQRPR